MERCLECAESSCARQLGSLSHMNPTRLWICTRGALWKPPIKSIAACWCSSTSIFIVSACGCPVWRRYDHGRE